jgi:hypothetical protein
MQGKKINGPKVHVEKLKVEDRKAMESWFRWSLVVSLSANGIYFADHQVLKNKFEEMFFIFPGTPQAVIDKAIQELCAKRDVDLITLLEVPADFGKHQWEATDTEGHAMTCPKCGMHIGFDDESWDKHLEGTCFPLTAEPHPINERFGTSSPNSKTLTDKDLATIIQKAVVTDSYLIDCADQYQHFLEELAALVTNHFGGTVEKVGYDETRKEWVSVIAYNECVPDGSVFDNFDQNVVWSVEAQTPTEATERILITGSYHRYGYQITSNNGDGTPIRSAGNTPGDLNVSIFDEGVDSLETIRQFCDKAVRLIAKERNAHFYGVSYDPNAEDDYLSATEGDRAPEARMKIAAENAALLPLAAIYGIHGQHPAYSRNDWQHEVSAGDTSRSYWEWVASKIEQIHDESEELRSQKTEVPNA